MRTRRLSRNPTVNFLFIKLLFYRGRIIPNQSKAEQELLELARVSAYMRFDLGMSRDSV